MRRFAIATLLLVLPAFALAGPSIVGSMNGWDPANPAYDLQPLGGGWTLVFNLTAGDYEYKCIETDAWEGTDFPGYNIFLNVPADSDVTFFANLGATVGVLEGDEFIAHQAPIIAGDFIDLWGGNEWDYSDPAGQMTQSPGTDLFVLEGALPAGHHECKVTLNESWGQDTGANFILDLDVETTGVFTYEFGTNTLTWDESVAVSRISVSGVKTLY